jgi:xanthine dehydrogenase small subunit
MTKPRSTLRFLFGEELRELSAIDPTLTILDWLRLEERKLGTKEGCAEGDCGACTVVVGRFVHGKLVHRAINACIAPLASLDGRHLVVIEHVKCGAALHPVQHAMVEMHGSQCGFCTPGIVMSLYALWLNEEDASEARIEDALAGNLCRCTGYQPIIAAGRAMFQMGKAAKAEWRKHRAAIAKRLAELHDERTLEMAQGERRFIAPASLAGLAKAVKLNPDATIIAGATDAGLWLTKEMRILDTVIYPGRVAELEGIEKRDGEIVIGAMTSLYDAAEALGRLHPHLRELLRRFGGEQIRNAGTVGGNIANGSPIGDLPPALIALGASLVLRRGAKLRELPLENFFLAYKKQDRRQGEFVEAVRIPSLPRSARFHASKVSKRFDEDISAVCGAFRLDLDRTGRIIEARLAYGGMAATPKRATETEGALIGKVWNEKAAEWAAPALEIDFRPLDDWRASARYRMLCAQNLLRRFAIECGDPKIETRIAGALSRAHLERDAGGRALEGQAR